MKRCFCLFLCGPKVSKPRQACTRLSRRFQAGVDIGRGKARQFAHQCRHRRQQRPFHRDCGFWQPVSRLVGGGPVVRRAGCGLKTNEKTFNKNVTFQLTLFRSVGFIQGSSSQLTPARRRKTRPYTVRIAGGAVGILSADCRAGCAQARRMNESALSRQTAGLGGNRERFVKTKPV
jgi:hypothetical protein